MQIFEFHFNPKAKEDLIFDSFCYEPENIYERKMGNLYMAGFLKNVLPQNVRFLDNLAKVLKEKYYKTLSSPENSLKESLRKTNEFLERISKEGDVSWLGNLSFAAISIKDFELNFTKVGDLKVFLLRNGQIIDIDQELKFEDIEPYPLKIFGNIVSGKLAENDIILILTKDVFDSFSQINLLSKIAGIWPFNQKDLKEVFNNKKEELLKISGICLFIVLSKEILPKEKEILTQQKPLKVFSFKKVFSPLFKIFRLPKTSFKKPAISSKLKIPQIELKLPKPNLKIKTSLFGKKTVLIFGLILFLILGFFIFEKRGKQQLEDYQTQLNQIQEKVDEAETFLIIAETNPQAEKKASSLFKESLEEISPLVNIASGLSSDFANQVLTLENTISENLYQLNKLKIIEEPELIFEFETRGFIPQKIIFQSQNLYFFSPYSENLFKIINENEGKIIEINRELNSVALLNDSILFFLKPNQLISFRNDRFSELISLEELNFSLDYFSSYNSNLYFLDKKSGEIIKYTFFGNFKWGSPQLWLATKTKKALNVESMAVDGSVWLLTKENVVERYYIGSFQETLELEIFPYPKDFSKILTSSQLPYLYLLEPVQKRIVILNKSGEIIKQFQSQEFDNLLDFTVLKDGKTIYLLNGLRVYRINL